MIIHYLAQQLKAYLAIFVKYLPSLLDTTLIGRYIDVKFWSLRAGLVKVWNCPSLNPKFSEEGFLFSWNPIPEESRAVKYYFSMDYFQIWVKDRYIYFRYILKSIFLLFSYVTQTTLFFTLCPNLHTYYAIFSQNDTNKIQSLCQWKTKLESFRSVI